MRYIWCKNKNNVIDPIEYNSLQNVFIIYKVLSII